MKTETLRLWPNSDIDSTLTRHVRDDGLARPAIFVIPGGGYGCVCENTEGSPIANRFDELGYQTFVLQYRVAPHAYPAPVQDAVRAMRLIRANAAAWGVAPDAIAACGFSAGGHLAAFLAILSGTTPDAPVGDAADAFSPVPNALLLCYPVTLSNEYGHAGSRKNFFGHPTSPEEDALFSLPEHIGDATPPAFLWTTLEDTTVPPENSLEFLRAMRAHSRPCELHVFPHGAHGMQLGYGRTDIALWPLMADAFLRESCGFRFA